MSISPCFGKNFCVTLLGSTTSCKGVGSSKSLIRNSNLGGGQHFFTISYIYASFRCRIQCFSVLSLKVSILSTSSPSFPSGIEESPLLWSHVSHMTHGRKWPWRGYGYPCRCMCLRPSVSMNCSRSCCCSSSDTLS